MVIYFTEEFSIDIENKFNFRASYDKELKSFFQHKFYGDDMEVLYISLFCMGAGFESFFKPRKPSYKSDSSVYIHQGVQVEREGKSLTYELRLNHQEYLKSTEVKPLLALNVLNSLDIIGTIKRIKHFDLAAFRNDFGQFFKLNGWLS
jgi:hypothetical protein